jgi:hypothetical protein
MPGGFICTYHLTTHLFNYAPFHTRYFLRSKIGPIPKGFNQNLSYSTNYRGIANSSILGRVIDNIILNRYHQLLISSDLQFGFKRGPSTDMCIMVLKETISYYVLNKSTVFAPFWTQRKRLTVYIIANCFSF